MYISLPLGLDYDHSPLVYSVQSQVSDLLGEDEGKQQEMCHRTLKVSLSYFHRLIDTKFVHSHHRSFQLVATLPDLAAHKLRAKLFQCCI